MIIFKKLTWRNFLSTGNNPTEVLLDKNTTTLIVGTNGAGKSTILDALTFALFGKPFRNINKPNLCNSINGKNALVTIEFDVGSTSYKVVRGLKPGIFEIHCNGQLVNQDSAAKDYQKLLEQQILKLNYKTFTQVVILGSASFVPFMQLPTHQRREVIEDILDISIFSIMNTLLKERINETKDQLISIENNITVARANVDAQKKLIGTMVNSKKEQVDQIKNQIAINEAEIESNNKRWDELNDQMNDIMIEADNAKELENLITAATKAKTKIIHTKEQTESNLSFFNNNEVCPSCSQGIPHEHKNNIVTRLNEDVNELNSNINILDEAYQKLLDRQKKLDQVNKELLTLNAQSHAIHSATLTLLKQNKKLELDIQSTKEDTGNIDVEKAKLKQIADDAMSLINRKSELFQEKQIQEVSSMLLKDTGIKTAIIKEYLPIMNKFINGYLTAMDFYVHFELDESFNEVIKSRFRDEFTYASFSEGEKQKIDLALLFAWRKIAKLKNSVNTNLLIMDEVFDSSLDTSSTDLLLDIINTIEEDANVFVISHKGDQLFDKFRSVVKFVKHNDYSTIEIYK